MAYPGVFEEFVDTLKWLRITHDERSLLEEIIHLERPTETTPPAISLREQRNLSPQLFSEQTNHRGYGNITKRSRHAKQTSAGPTGVHIRRERHSMKQRHRNLASVEARTIASESLLRLSSSNTPVEDEHPAFVVSWQSADLPLWANESGPQTPVSADVCGKSGQSSSSSAIDRATPSEHDTQGVEELHDYIKIPWSDNTME